MEFSASFELNGVGRDARARRFFGSLSLSGRLAVWCARWGTKRAPAVGGTGSRRAAMHVYVIRASSSSWLLTPHAHHFHSFKSTSAETPPPSPPSPSLQKSR